MNSYYIQIDSVRFYHDISLKDKNRNTFSTKSNQFKKFLDLLINSKIEKFALANNYSMVKMDSEFVI